MCLQVTTWFKSFFPAEPAPQARLPSSPQPAAPSSPQPAAAEEPADPAPDPVLSCCPLLLADAPVAVTKNFIQLKTSGGRVPVKDRVEEAMRYLNITTKGLNVGSMGVMKKQGTIAMRLPSGMVVIRGPLATCGDGKDYQLTPELKVTYEDPPDKKHRTAADAELALRRFGGRVFVVHVSVQKGFNVGKGKAAIASEQAEHEVWLWCGAFLRLLDDTKLPASLGASGGLG